MQCNEMQYNSKLPIICNAMQHSIIWCTEMHSNAIQYIVMQYNDMKCNVL